MSAYTIDEDTHPDASCIAAEFRRNPCALFDLYSVARVSDAMRFRLSSMLGIDGDDIAPDEVDEAIAVSELRDALLAEYRSLWREIRQRNARLAGEMTPELRKMWAELREDSIAKFRAAGAAFERFFGPKRSKNASE